MVDRTSDERQLGAKRRVGADAAQIARLVEKAPRFAQLAKAAQGQPVEVSDEQRKFLADFANAIAKGANVAKTAGRVVVPSPIPPDRFRAGLPA